MSSSKATASVKKSSNGLAFDVILKPAATDIPATPRGMKPIASTGGKKGPSISKRDIERKMKEAELQRKAQDKARQERLMKHEQHVQEVRKKKEEIVSQTPR